MSLIDDIVTAAPAPTSAQGPRNAGSPYDDIVNAAPPPPSYRPSLEVGMQQDPKVEANNRKLAAQLNLPKEAIAADPAVFEQQARVRQAHTDVADAPATQSWLAQSPGNTAIAHDQLPELSRVERYMVNVGHLGSATAGIPRATGAGLWSVATDIVAPWVGLVAPERAEAMRQYWGANAAAAQSVVSKERQQVQTEGFVEEVVFGAIGSTIQNTPVALTALAASQGNPLRATQMALTAMSVPKGVEKYQEARTEGKDVTGALAYGTFAGVTEAVFELAPTNALLAGAKHGVVNYIKDLAVKEGLGEMKTEFWDSASEYLYLHPEKTLGDFVKDTAYQMTVAGFSGMLGGSMQAGAMHAVRKSAETVLSFTEKKQNAEQFAEAMAKTSEDASTLNARSPEAVADFIQHVAPDTVVHVDAKDFNSVLLQKGINPADFVQQLPSIAGSYQTATETDGILTIPAGEYISVVGTSPIGKDMDQHIRSTPDALSVAEAAATAPDAQALVAAESERVLEESIAAAPMREAAVEIEKQMTAQQEARAATKDVADTLATEMQQATPEMSIAEVKMNAKLIAEQYAQLAAMYPGMDARTMMQKATLAAEEGTGGQLSQADQIDWNFLNEQIDKGEQLSVADAKKHARIARLVNLYGGKADYETYRLAFKEWSSALDKGGFKGIVHDPENSATLESLRKKSDRIKKILSSSEGGLASIRQLGPEDKLTWTHEVSEPLGNIKGGYTTVFTYNDVGTGRVLTKQEYLAAIAPTEATLQIIPNGASEPALRTTISSTGEFTIYGPPEKGALYKEYAEKGWAELATGKGGVESQMSDGTRWTRLTDVTGPQLTTLLGRVHALLRTTQDMEHVGMYWTRATGATGTSAESNEGLLGRVGAIYLQEDRASLAFDTNNILAGAVMRMSKASNVSSYAHEGAHFFLELRSHLYNQPDAPQRLKDDFDATLKWFGVEDKAAWDAMTLEQKRPYHEKWAEGWETYMFEGKAPSLELGRLFRAFSEAMKKVYVSLRNMRVPLNDEIRGVFDRMLASDEAIARAKAASNVAAMATPDAPITPEVKAAEDDMVATAESALATKALRDMRWLSNAKSKVLRDLQATADEARNAIRAEEAAKMADESAWQAVAAMQQKGGKLDANLLTSMTLKESEKKAIAPFTVKAEGRHPDVVAMEHNYLSGQEMILDITSISNNGGNYEKTLQQRTDARMFHEHAELKDAQSIALEADKALHGDAMLRFLATGYKNLIAPNMPVRVLEAGVKQAAQAKIASMKVSEVSPAKFSAAAARSGKAVAKAIAAKDMAVARRAYLAQMVNAAMTKEAYAFVAERDKALAATREFLRRPDDKLAKSYDVNLVNAMRAVASAFGITAPPKEGKSAWDHLSRLESNDPAAYAEIKVQIDEAMIAATRTPKGYADTSVDTLRSIFEILDVLKMRAKQAQEVTLEGKTVNRKELQARLTAETAQGKALFDMADQRKLRSETKMDKVKTAIMSLSAAANHMTNWVQSKGLPFDSAWAQVVRTVRGATTAMRKDEVKYITKYKELLESIGDDLHTPFKSVVVGTEFKDKYQFKNKAQVLGFLMHMGNASSMRKNLVGRGFGELVDVGGVEQVDSTAAWAFLNRMVETGILDQRHFDGMQKIWDLMEDIKPIAQKAHHHMNGYYFKPVEAQPFEMRFKDGTTKTYQGGYVPAMADRFADVAEATKQEARLEAIADSVNVIMPTTPSGFVNTRKVYDYPLEMDIGILGRHISNVLRYAHVGPAVSDMQRAIKGKDVQQQLAESDPQAYNSLILPWLNRAAKQTTQIIGRTPYEKTTDQMYNNARINTTIGIMFMNIPNTLQQATGLSLGATLASPHKIMKGVLSDATSRSDTRQFIASKSDFMALSFEHSAAEQREAINSMLYDTTLLESAENFSKRHAFFLQTAVQNFVNSSVWTAAYDDAIANEGQAAKNGVDSKDDAACVAWADSVVQRTQGTSSPEDLAHWSEGGAFHLLFKMFHNYFDMNRSLLLSEGTRALRVDSKAGVAKRWGYLYLTGFAAVALAGDIIVKALQQNWTDFDDEDEDGEWIDEFFSYMFMTQVKYGIAMTSVAGQAVMAGVNGFNGEVTGDRMNLSPVASTLGRGLHVGIDVAKGMETGEMPSRTVSDSISLLQLFTPVPVSIVNKPYKYLTGVNEGKFVEPGPLDVALGMATGRGAKE